MADPDAGLEPTAPTEPSDGTGKTFTQEQVNDLLARQKGDVQRKYADYDDVKAKAAKLDELESQGQTDIERLTGERDALKNDNQSLAQTNLRLQVALEKGLVGDKASLFERLRGDTKEELAADAEQLLTLITPQAATDFDGGARQDPDKPKDPVQDHNALLLAAAGIPSDT